MAGKAAATMMMSPPTPTSPGDEMEGIRRQVQRHGRGRPRVPRETSGRQEREPEDSRYRAEPAIVSVRPCEILIRVVNPRASHRTITRASNPSRPSDTSPNRVVATSARSEGSRARSKGTSATIAVWRPVRRACRSPLRPRLPASCPASVSRSGPLPLGWRSPRERRGSRHTQRTPRHRPGAATRRTSPNGRSRRARPQSLPHLLAPRGSCHRCQADSSLARARGRRTLPGSGDRPPRPPPRQRCTCRPEDQVGARPSRNPAHRAAAQAGQRRHVVL